MPDRISASSKSGRGSSKTSAVLGRARTFLTTVVPLPGAVPDLEGGGDAEGSEASGDAEHSPVSPRSTRSGPDVLMQPTLKSYVTVYFDPDAVAGAVGSGATGSRKSSLDPGPASTNSQSFFDAKLARRLSCGSEKDELRVGRQFFFFSTFLRGSGVYTVDAEMEKKFARSKYFHFRLAFTNGSFLMSLGALLLCLKALAEEAFFRFGLLFGGVCPIYFVIGLWVLKRKSQYLRASNSLREKLLIGLLCFQSFLIVASEWVRAELDYGLLVMHLGFVFNFSPLSTGAMGLVTVVFGMAPYSLLLLLYSSNDVSYGKLVWGLTEWYSGAQDCYSEGLSIRPHSLQVQQRILVPLFIMFLQAIVTERRDESLRMDLINKEQLKSQQRLLAFEKRRNEGLLRSMLPWKIIEALKTNARVNPQMFEDVTVIFMEICDFHALCHQLQPDDVMEVLNVIYHEFDRLSDLLAVYKVETVMQVYMAVVGCPEPVLNHADVATHFALAAQRSMVHLRHRIGRNLRASAAPGSPELKPRIRVGLNSGPLRAGVVGMESPRYKLVGDTVNTASRMESTCEPDNIQVSRSTQKRLSVGMFEMEDRGSISVKGKGTMKTAYVKGYAGDDGSHDRHRVLIEQHARPHYSMEALASPKGPSPWAQNLESEVERSCSRASLTSRGSMSEADDVDVRSCSSADGGREKGAACAIRCTKAEEDISYSLASTSPVKSIGLVAEGGGTLGLPRSPRPTLELDGLTLDSSAANSGVNTEDSSAANSGVNTEDRLPTVDMDLPPMTHKLTSALPLPTLRYGTKSIDAGRGLVSIVSAALARDAREETSTLVATHSRKAIFISWHWSCLSLERLAVLFLLAPSSQDLQSWMQELSKDRPIYLAHVMPRRLALAQKFTTIMLFVLSLVSALDYLALIVEDGEAFRAVMLVRNLGNNMVAIVYLIGLSSAHALGIRCAQYLTMAMLMVECVALMACSILFYKSEPIVMASVVIFSAVTLFYTVCGIRQRLLMCSFSVLLYVVARAVTCNSGGYSAALRDSIVNIGFLVVFVGFMACGVYLQEHLGHGAHYEQRRAKQRLERIAHAKAAGSHLLNTLLPAHVVPLVGEGVSPIAEYHADITIIFTDIKGFTNFSSKISPTELFMVLNSMFSAFDEIILNWGLHKVEIIGDAYVISAGCPAAPQEHIGPSEYAMRAVEVGLALQRILPSVCDEPNVTMRVGMHTGSVVAGVVGKKGPRYHLFGSDVVFAEKMESNGIPGRVHISDATHTMLVDSGMSYEFEERVLEIKGEEGLQRTWLVNKSNSKEAFQIQMQLAQKRHQAMTSSRPGIERPGDR